MKLNWRILVGVIILVFGGLMLLRQLEVLPIDAPMWQFIFPALFATSGVAFLVVLIASKQNWWAAIPGLTLLGLGGLIGLDMIPGFPGDLGAAIFLACIGLSFWIIYILDKTRWWAIIPGGTLVSVAALVASETLLGGDGGVGIMFLGFAITFALVALLPNGSKPMKWPWIPAGVLFVMGAAFLSSVEGWMSYILAGGMVLIGAGLIVFTLIHRKPAK
jgi:hypothetical protein